MIFAGSVGGVVDLSGTASDHKILATGLENSRSRRVALEKIGSQEVPVSGIGPGS